LATLACARAGEPLPPEVAHASRRLLLDTLGCSVAGHETASSRVVTKVMTGMGGVGESTVLVGGEGGPCAVAASVNAHRANALDAEETLPSTGHLAACTVPAALAVAEREGRSGAELLTAVAVGFEVGGRIGMSLRHLARGDDGEVAINPVAGQ